ncbi:hypothetical protein NDU88_004555, partial [Pleurodeles waltl]
FVNQPHCEKVKGDAPVRTLPVNRKLVGVLRSTEVPRSGASTISLGSFSRRSETSFILC